MIPKVLEHMRLERNAAAFNMNTLTISSNLASRYFSTVRLTSLGPAGISSEAFSAANTMRGSPAGGPISVTTGLRGFITVAMDLKRGRQRGWKMRGRATVSGRNAFVARNALSSHEKCREEFGAIRVQLKWMPAWMMIQASLVANLAREALWKS